MFERRGSSAVSHPVRHSTNGEDRCRDLRTSEYHRGGGKREDGGKMMEDGKSDRTEKDRSGDTKKEVKISPETR